MHPFSRRPAAIVIGSDDVGSAVAIALDRAGYATVLCDDVDPPWPRRGMAFTDAWYAGVAELAGATAVFCATVKSVPAVLERPRAIAATTWSWRGVATALPVHVIVDAIGIDTVGRELRAFARPGQLTVGIGTGHRAGANVDVVVAAEGAGRAARAEQGDADDIAVVRAPTGARFATSRRIGDHVSAGEAVGTLGRVPVIAPRSGVLLGLCARGAWVRAGLPIVEVDPADDAAGCFGIGTCPQAIGRAVVAALGRALPASPPLSALRTS